MSFKVRLLPEADVELIALPKQERAAMVNALIKVAEIGDQLGAPHSSAVMGMDSFLRELRPRRGASPWRAFYSRVGDEFVVGSIGPEAQQNPRGFDKSVGSAVERIRAFAEEVEESDGKVAE